ncbi:programmed cell death 2 [Cryptosporidium parvum Iowa II]|uniref:Programmed cell death 2, putative n=1 Tax=Cryptosporidium parvum (strain Iowa II) TaxID=353152 RepID=A3FQA0_CRYPI|nr:programmed cell death 2 [Cryptosporidium parvum Iowa II]EAZ51409.1 programmed cell death 2, putative [Cryptosporidium parvum Iowa II]
MNDVLLGYLEKPRTPLVLDSRYFPSKFGGKPAWLNPQNLPQYRDLQCNSCGTRMRFLLQVYAPQDDREDLFHRSIFLFICTNCTCSVQAFRCQLPRMNDYYDYNPAPTSFLFEDVNPEETILELKELKFNNICNTCGLPLSTESKCQQSNTHDKCNAIDSGAGKVILDEFSLDIEICSTDEEDEDDDQEETQDDNFENDPDEEMTPITGENDLGLEELPDQLDNINKKDVLFDKFINNSRKYPGHIIRYSHNGSPLWISDKNIPSETPQKCPLCNSNRVFEFQIQPEAIVLGNLPSKVEFGVIAIFTCSKNCRIDYYAPECVLIQNNPY